MDLLSRLKTYMTHLSMSSSQFADVAQIPRPTLSQILSGRNRKISNELLEKLHAAFPRLNVSWLLFGDGEMEMNDIPQIAPQGGYQGAPKPPQMPPIPEKPLQNNDLVDIDRQETKPAPEQPIRKPLPEPPLQPLDSSPVSLNTDSNKKIQTIMVFYSDNSFEIFRPSQR